MGRALPHTGETKASGSSWLCRDDFDRERMLDMEERVRPVRQRALAILAVALIAAGPWLGWWPALFLIPAALCFGAADLLMPRVARPELLMFGAWIGSGVVIGGAVALSGGAKEPTLAWLAIPVITLSSRFPMRGVVAGVFVNIVILLVVAFGVDSQRVIDNPVLVIAPLALLLCVAVLSTPLMRSDIQHRSDAVIDQLTGMLNRKALSTRVIELAQQSELTGESVGIIVGDLDHFKMVNDTRGHSVGDVVLKEVAYQLRKQLRAFDLAYRLGGEEFLILLPGSDLKQSANLAERLREGVAANGVAGGVAITMSFGVGASEPGEPFDYATVFKVADEALYRAKHNGRDQVCLSEPVHAPEALRVPAFA
ncbi:MAG TPA: GGDEF domain-containing protein [Solirubrobacteraceae bacterium]|jgi:diguanylate cyclase (GGDEF)-like protein|nr:GGDEF domain-containing protein [Solirubrobacteraceae bacterium]